MRILMAFLCPPIAVLMCGKWFQGLIISPLLTMCLWVPGIIHAIIVVNAFGKEDREHDLHHRHEHEHEHGHAQCGHPHSHRHRLRRHHHHHHFLHA